MKKYSWLLVLVVLAFACQVQNDEAALPDEASARVAGTSVGVPGFTYGINPSTTDGYSWTIEIDQSAAHDISHLIFSDLKGCDGTLLSFQDNDITTAIDSVTINGQDWSGKTTPAIGNGEACLPFLSNITVKLDKVSDSFNGGTVTVFITFNVQVSGGSFFINSARNCVGSNGVFDKKNPTDIVLAPINFYKPCPPKPECTGYQSETGWATGTRYVTRGNWATYTPYQAGATVNIYAGQNMFAGTVTMSAASGGMVTITIALNADWSFQNVGEPVKIQGYGTAPTGNPSPGRFSSKGTSTTVTLPAAAFYGIHLDLKKCLH